MRRLAALGLGFLAATAPVRGAEPVPAPAKVFAKTCGPCHGKDGRGAPHLAKMLGAAPTDLAAPAVQALGEAELRRIVVEGKGKMPAFGERLDPGQLEAILAFMRSLGPTAPATAAPPPAPAPAEGAPEGGASLGAAIFKVSCLKCHGEDGRGRPELARALGLARERIDLRDPATRARLRAGLEETVRGGHGRMPGFEGRLADAQIDAVLDHLFAPEPAPAR